MQLSNNYEINRLKIPIYWNKQTNKKTQKQPIKKHKQKKLIKESLYDFYF